MSPHVLLFGRILGILLFNGMTFDFRALQTRTNKIIASGSTGTNAKIMVYPVAGSTDTEGGINFPVTGIGTDVFMFVSGSATDKTLFGGGLHVSGTVTSDGTVFGSTSSIDWDGANQFANNGVFLTGIDNQDLILFEDASSGFRKVYSTIKWLSQGFVFFPLAAKTAPVSTDIMVIEDLALHLSRQVELGNLAKSLRFTGSTEQANPSGSDYVLIDSIIDGASRKVEIGNLATGLRFNSVTNETTLSDTDALLVDVTASTATRQVLMSDLVAFLSTQGLGGTSAISGAGAGYHRIDAPVPLALWDFDKTGNDSLGIYHLTISTGTPLYKDTSGDTTSGDWLFDPPNETAGNRKAYDAASLRWEGGVGDATAGSLWNPLVLTGSMTVMCWCRPDTLSSTNYIANWSASPQTTEAQNQLWQLGFSAANFKYDHMSGVVTNETFTGTGSPMRTLVWQHVALTRAANGKDLVFYHNGRIHASHSMATAPTGGTASYLNVSEHPNTFNAFNGLIAGLALYDTELSHAQVYEDYNYVRRGIINKG